jgi:hypothetical protein
VIDLKGNKTRAKEEEQRRFVRRGARGSLLKRHKLTRQTHRMSVVDVRAGAEGKVSMISQMASETVPSNRHLASSLWSRSPSTAR